MRICLPPRVEPEAEDTHTHVDNQGTVHPCQSGRTRLAQTHPSKGRTRGRKQGQRPNTQSKPTASKASKASTKPPAPQRPATATATGKQAASTAAATHALPVPRMPPPPIFKPERRCSNCLGGYPKRVPQIGKQAYPPLTLQNIRIEAKELPDLKRDCT